MIYRLDRMGRILHPRLSESYEAGSAVALPPRFLPCAAWVGFQSIRLPSCAFNALELTGWTRIILASDIGAIGP